MATFPTAPRVGVVGLGGIGRGLIDRIIGSDGRVELAFVHARTPPAIDVTGSTAWADRFIDDPRAAPGCRPTLIVEAAHPAVTLAHGAAFLGTCDYLPLSLSALAEPEIYASLEAAAATAGHRLWIPHGALVGLDSLAERTQHWSRVTVQFAKHPASLDFAAARHLAAPSTKRYGRRVVFDGSVREIAALFPRNVNAMVACALATVGVDACNGVLISDDSLDHGVLDVRAEGNDGARVHIRRQQPMTGVSGTEMADSAWSSVLRAARAEPTTSFC